MSVNISRIFWLSKFKSDKKSLQKNAGWQKKSLVSKLLVSEEVIVNIYQKIRRQGTISVPVAYHLIEIKGCVMSVYILL